MNNRWVKEEIKRKIRKCFELEYQNLWDVTKAVLTGKFVALNASIRKEK